MCANRGRDGKAEKANPKMAVAVFESYFDYLSYMSSLLIATALDIAAQEALDSTDPLRHLMAVSSYPTSSGDSDIQSNVIVIPAQRPSVADQTIQLDFPRSEGGTISIHLDIDSSPGCGGIAWPAGMVRLITTKVQGLLHNVNLSRLHKVLAAYLVQLGPQYLQGKNILELGSGTGLVGLIAGALGGGRIWITDQVFV